MRARLTVALEPKLLDDMTVVNAGLTRSEVEKLQHQYGKNEISTHRTKPITVLVRQLNNPILWVLSGALLISGLLGDITNASMITVIVALSIGLGFVTEYRAEKATEDLHSRITHHATVVRDGITQSILVSELVPGDVVKLHVGSVVPADLQLLEVEGLECDESVITGESLPVTKSVTESALNPDANKARMGTVVRIGSATGVVTATGDNTEFGTIALALGQRQPQTNFQLGLKDFSVFLLRIALVIIFIVIVGNLYLKRPVIESILYALALAVGMTPQLLPAIVSTALAMGSRHLAKQGVLVKRLVSIEDLGDVDILLTDKTGTLTTGEVSFESSYPVGEEDPVVYGLLATDVEYEDAARSLAGLNQLDAALWSARSAPENVRKIDSIPFDHVRRMTSALVDYQGQRIVVAKGSPDELLAICDNVSPTARSLLQSLYEQGARVIAVAQKSGNNLTSLSHSDESALKLLGFLTFTDPPKEDARESLEHLQELGIEVKVATGDSLEVARTVCEKVGLEVRGAISGRDIESMSDETLAQKVMETSVFARVSPEQKARILLALRGQGKSIAFLGDGVNDAIALHDSDVGISVDSATDVAKDAADVVLLEKDLGVLANGIRQGRRVFSNTMKYIFMATSADFGNMFSASLGSLLLPFLPMLPTQVLLQDLLYDASQLSIPSDHVDREQVARPSHWNIAQIRRFMWIFGLASSIFDFMTFGLLLWILDAQEAEFHTGWFIESLATATLVVLVIRTRRVPFFKSTPSRALLASILGINLFAFGLTLSPFASDLGFVPLPLTFYLALSVMIVMYLVIVESAKRHLFGLRENSRSR